MARTGQGGNRTESWGLVAALLVGLAACATPRPDPPGDDSVSAGAGNPGLSRPPTVCPVAVIDSADAAPSRWDLHGAFGGVDLLSPVHDQMAREDCWIFAEVSALEIEYVATYARSHGAAATEAFASTFNLSEQYLMDVYFLTVSAPLFVDGFGKTLPAPIPTIPGTVPAANLTALNPTCGGVPTFGLPKRSDWSTPRSNATILYSMMQSVPLVSASGERYFGPNDTYDFSTLLTLPDVSPRTARLGTIVANRRSLSLDLDLANFQWSNSAAGGPSRSVYPPVPVHEDARYAPLKSISIKAYNANATPPQRLPARCAREHLWDYPIVAPHSPPSAEQATCYAALAAPFEATLAKGHPIVFSTNPKAWNWDTFPLGDFWPPMSDRSYWTGGLAASSTVVLDCAGGAPGDPDGCAGPYPLQDSGRHTAVLIGYDRDRQLFHIENSWGTSWGTAQTRSPPAHPDGTAWMTYDLFFRTVVGPTYIDGVWDPNGALATDDPVPAPLPNGAWLGFWRASLAGAAGVAVIGRFPSNDAIYDPAAGIFYGQPGPPAGTFYPSDGGSPTDFQLTRWGDYTTTYWADFGALGGEGRPLFRLSKTFGSARPDATFTPLAPSAGRSSTWSKCTDGAGRRNVLPESYLDALSDPYVLPPCDATTPWHVEPTWTCPPGSFYEEQVEYEEDAIPGAGAAFEVSRACLVKGAAPQCGGPLAQDLTQSTVLAPDVLPVAMNYAVEPDRYGVFEQGWASMPDLVDACFPRGDSSCVTRGDCAMPTCPEHDGEPPSAKQPLLGANPWVWVHAGADVCVHEVLVPSATCPAGYELSPNGTDCLAQY